MKPTTGLLLLILAFACAAMLPAFIGGIPGGNDQMQHFQFARTVYDGVSGGDLHPSFAANANHGFGDHGIRFYPPVVYYVLAGAYAVLGDWYFAILFGFTLAFFVGGVGVYLWTRDELEHPRPLVAALIFTLAPYHLNEFYNNALFAEFFGMAVLPFCFLFLTRVCRGGRWYDVCALAAAYGVLILTHLPLTVIGSIALGIFGLLMLRSGSVVATLGKLAVSIASSLIVTAFYWSRWLGETTWIKLSTPEWTSAIYDYRLNFLLVPDHFLKFGEDALNLWFADLMLVVTLLVATPTIAYLLTKTIPRSRFILALAGLLAAAVFMTTPLSSLIWDNAVFLQKIQFPWRWLAIVTLAVAPLAAIGLVFAGQRIEAVQPKLLSVSFAMLTLVFVFTAVFLTKGAAFTNYSLVSERMDSIAEAESCECWWPIWAERAAFAQAGRVAADGRRVDVVEWTAKRCRFRVEAGDRTSVTVAAFYYPHWRAAVNGGPTVVEKNEFGMITIPIGPEPAEVELQFIEPRFVTAARIASGTTAVSLFAVMAFILLKSRKTAE